MGLSSRRKAQTLFRTNGYYLHHSDIIIDVIGINRKYVLYVTNLPRQRWLSGVCIRLADEVFATLGKNPI